MMRRLLTVVVVPIAQRIPPVVFFLELLQPTMDGASVREV